jgi:hypothetical protein
MSPNHDLPDVYSAHEIARAANVRRRTWDLRRRGADSAGRGPVLHFADAVSRSIRWVMPDLFQPAPGVRREPAPCPRRTLHAAILAGIVLISTMGWPGRRP